ncbi:DUF92 domain-containing protein [Bacillus shivajii]|uniref:DUF92 domain-containing protein n=1 Tax=Bacillus shivajii TaxID=1983719 RepID=UPI001CFC171E|nr:DUF92 domain-containing protein [Bacillus shivajii]UCZ54551.1 DUF92 domain-containing protein [Bacillus shivajii]
MYVTILAVIGVYLLSVVAYKKGSLTKGGALAAFAIGATIAISLSLFGLIILGAFFLSSTMIGKYIRSEVEEIERKGERRDAIQVLANGGWASVSALIYGMTSMTVWLIAFIAALTAANSDTWASSIGKLSKRRPIHFFTFNKIEYGQSGGMTIAGTLGAIAGALFISLVTWLIAPLLHPSVEIGVSIIIIIAVIGFLAQYIDTVVGGTIQALFQCRICGKVTEKNLHCKINTEKIRGFACITNDVTNHACTLSAIGLTWLYFLML